MSLNRSPVRAQVALLTALVLSACGSGGGNAPAGPPPFSGTTQVTLVLSGTANDRLAEFDLSIQGITLTNQAGQVVPVLAGALPTEAIHVNGSAQPLITVAVPQDVYTAANVSLSSAALTCVTLLSSGSLDSSTFADNGNPVATVTLPQAITISGTNLGLELNLQVSASAQIGACSDSATFSFTPSFVLTAFDLPTGAPGSPVLGTLEGQVSAVNEENGTLQLVLSAESPGTAPLTIQTSAGTLTQGFAGLAALGVGQFVQVDGGLQSDGSVNASRIALADPAAVDVQEGPILLVASSVPYLTLYPLMEQGADERIDTETLDFANASFHIGGGFTNLGALPFVPSFTAANMVAGQNVYISTPTFNYQAPPDYTGVATTITLEPQTLDGTVIATATSGGFTVYTVQLAAYDLFPALAQQPGQTTLLANPSFVQVYVDATTVQSNTTPPTTGSVLRFFGLVFDDGGTLRMDCGRIEDGVAL